MDPIERQVRRDLNEPPRPKLIEDAVSYLKQFRRGLGWSMASLQHLAIRCVLKNHRRFVQKGGKHPSPLEKLSSSPASQDLLVALENDLALSQEDRRDLALLLANQSTVQLNYRQFRLKCKSKNSDNKFFKKMGSSCPNLEKVDISYRVWKEFNQSGQCCILRVVSNKWKNLKALCLDAQRFDRQSIHEPFGDPGCRTHPCQGKSIIRAVCNHLPKLEFLDVTVTPLTEEEVDELSKMLLLRHLRLNLLVEYSSEEKHSSYIDQIVHAAGRVPNLQNFGFCILTIHYETSYAKFVDMFGKLYPNKRLALEAMWMEENLLGRWPQNLSLEELHLSGQNLDLSALLQIKGPLRELHLPYGIPIHQKYPLVERFGPDITHLSIYSSEDIDVHRIVFFCKKLQVVKIFLGENCKLFKGKYPLRKMHFKNCSSFLLWKMGGFGHAPAGELNPTVVELTKLYFLGSEQYLKRLVINSSNEMEAMLSVLDNEPQHTCLDRVEEVVFNLRFCHLPLLIYVPRALLALSARSPFLRKVHICDDSNYYFPPHWLFNLLTTVGITFNEVDTSGEEEMDTYAHKDIPNILYCYFLYHRKHKSFTIVNNEVQIM